jgi:CheY-like chemotaxis protein
MNNRIILIAEDHEDDLFFVRRAIQKAGIVNPQLVFRDGAEVIEYLDRTKWNEETRPALLLLDLQMPVTDGYEVLTWLRKNPPMHGFPVIVLTGSESQRDSARAFALGAQGLFIKPVDPAGFAEFSKVLLNLLSQDACSCVISAGSVAVGAPGPSALRAA